MLLKSITEYVVKNEIEDQSLPRKAMLAEKPADHRCDKNIIWLRVKHSDINCVGAIFNVML